MVLNQNNEEEIKSPVSDWDSPGNLPEQKLGVDIKPEISEQAQNKKTEEPVPTQQKKEKTIEVTHTESEYEEEEEEEEEESESEWTDNMVGAAKKPWDPRTDKFLEIESDKSDDFKKSLENFNPAKDISQSMRSSDFDAAYVLPGQNPVSDNEAHSIENIQNVMDEEAKTGKDTRVDVTK